MEHNFVTNKETLYLTKTKKLSNSGQYYYVRGPNPPFGFTAGDRLAHAEIYQAMIEREVVFLNADGNDVLIDVMHTMEKHKIHDKHFLNRIIRGGGFLEYIKTLENVPCGTVRAK